MDQKNPIDQWLKQSFKQTPPSEKEAIWAKVSASLDKKKKKRFGMWWLFGAAALVGVFTIAYLNLSDRNNPSVDHPQQIENTKDIPNLDSKSQDESNVDYAVAQNTTKAESLNEDAKTNANVNNSELDHTSSNNNSNKGSNSKSDDLSQEDNTKPLEQGDRNNPTDQKSQDVEPNTVNPHQTQTRNTVIALQWFTSPIKPEANNVTLDHFLPNLVGIDPFDINSYDKKDPVKEIVLNNPWSIGFNAGFSPSQEKVSIDNKGLPFVHKSYLKLREQGERMMMNAQFELYVRKNFGNFFIQTGFSQLNRGFIQNYQYEINEIPITSALGGNTPDANGRFPLDDQTPYLVDLTPETINYQGRRTSRFTEIPLNLGYTFNTGKVLISPSFGAGLNFTQQSGGTTIDYQYLTLIPHKDLFKVNKTGYSFNSSVMIEYPLGKNIFVQVQPFYHRFLKSNTEVINQKPISYGLNIGLNLKLQNNE